jgi:hypothetical protein
MIFNSNNLPPGFSASPPPIPRFQTDDARLLADPDYQTVYATVLQLWEGGIIQRGRGYCLSMADIIHNLLKQKGINSRIVECKLTVVGIDPPGLLLVGHDGLNQVQQSAAAIDSHVVCVTETKIPMLIDLSIIGVRPEIPWILEALDSQGSSMVDLDFGTSKWLYQSKEVSRIPQQHQVSILERFKTDQKTSARIRLLMILVVVSLAVSSINAARGMFDFYMVYHEKNYWGPDTMKRLIDKVEKIEQHIDTPKK